MRSRIVSRARGKMKINILVAALSLLFVLPSEARLQGRKPMTIAELVTYNGADRENILYNGAKTEGKITWYTSWKNSNMAVRRKIWVSNDGAQTTVYPLRNTRRSSKAGK